MSKIVVCNTGTTGKVHARFDESAHTLCGQIVFFANKDEEKLDLACVGCLRCQKIIQSKRAESSAKTLTEQCGDKPCNTNIGNYNR